MSLFYTILAVASGLVTGAVIALRFIAPRTTSTFDDSILRRLEQLEELMKLLPGGKDLIPPPGSTTTTTTSTTTAPAP